MSLAMEIKELKAKLEEATGQLADQNAVIDGKEQQISDLNEQLAIHIEESNEAIDTYKEAAEKMTVERDEATAAAELAKQELADTRKALVEPAYIDAKTEGEKEAVDIGGEEVVETEPESKYAEFLAIGDPQVKSRFWFAHKAEIEQDMKRIREEEDGKDA